MWCFNVHLDLIFETTSYGSSRLTIFYFFLRKGEKCQVQTTYSTCGSTIKLTGNCEYNSDVLAKCQYTIVTASSEGQTQAVISTRGRRTKVPRGKTVEECVTVSNEGSFVSISDDVCQRCTADYLRSLIPNQTCSKG